MDALYQTVEDRQRVAVTNTGDDVAYLASRNLKRHSREDPFVGKDDAGEPVVCAEVVYNGAAEVPPGVTVEWVVRKGDTLWKDGDVELVEVDEKGPKG